MKTPTWGLVTGILMMFFGGCSVMSDVQSINMPSMLEMQQNMLKGITDGIKTTNADSVETEKTDSIENHNSRADQALIVDNMGKTMDEMFYMSDFSKTWIVRFGYIGIFVSFIYILGGVFLLIRKKFSLELAYAALGLSILFGVIQSIVLSTNSSNGLMSMSTGFSQVFGIMIDIILVIVIVVSDRTAYKEQID
jgi:hypothetical protein